MWIYGVENTLLMLEVEVRRWNLTSTPIVDSLKEDSK